ncbi:glycoside hydrolase family 27 protein [Apiospora phragmitis]|uniref:Alpha-galactosidase n=1 Tax=Apiospora phragmitis TaxID=2905665 RepID=A0ABR1VF83_9PEZI
MGWTLGNLKNNWNSFGCDVSEHLLLSTSEQLVSLGLRDLGYQYVVLDDCWQQESGRDKHGKLQPDPGKFPNGLRSILDRLHDQGLKFGMYSSAGEITCARFAGPLDHETDDAESFVSWGVDMLKYDSCYHMGRIGTPLISFNRFKTMSDALKATGRNILLNLCNWGEDFVHTWGMSIANSWRISGDIYDSFTRPDDLCGCHPNVLSDPYCIARGPIARIPGGWQDADMLAVGLGGMTDEEYRAHFALWAALKSPLFLGNDIRSMPPSALTIVNNPDILALSQDPHGRSITRVRRDTENIPRGRAVVFLNAGGADLDMTCSLAELFTAFGPGGAAPHVRSDWAVHDLWAHRMPEATAAAILAAATADERAALLKKADWYNATETPYAVGLRNEDPRLFREKIGVVEAGGVLRVSVKSHAARVFRLRRIAKAGEKLKPKSIDRVAKDELQRNKAC